MAEGLTDRGTALLRPDPAGPGLLVCAAEPAHRRGGGRGGGAHRRRAPRPASGRAAGTVADQGLGTRWSRSCSRWTSHWAGLGRAGPGRGGRSARPATRSGGPNGCRARRPASSTRTPSSPTARGCPPSCSSITGAASASSPSGWHGTSRCEPSRTPRRTRRRGSTACSRRSRSATPFPGTGTARAATTGTCLDNGGGAALVCGPETRSWRDLDLSAAGMDASLNGQYIKSGQGRAAMGHPVTSLTWMLNWARAHGRAVRAWRHRQHRHVHRAPVRRVRRHGPGGLRPAGRGRGVLCLTPWTGSTWAWTSARRRRGSAWSARAGTPRWPARATGRCGPGTAGSSRTRRPGRGRWPRHCAAYRAWR